MLDLVSSLLAVVAILLAAFGLGRPLFRKLALAEDDLFSTVVWCLALGLVVAGWFFSMLALAGWLYVSVVILVTLSAAFWGLGETCCVWMTWRAGSVINLKAPATTFESAGPTVAPPIARALWLLAGLAAAGSLVAALAPPESPEALARYLELAKTFLLSHGVVSLPYNDYARGPLMLQMWYLWGLALDGPVAVGLLQWVFGVLLGAACVLLARPLLGSRGALVSGALTLLTPGISYQMAAPLDDLALALFTTLLLAAWWRGVVALQGRSWFMVAGLMAGAAIGTKSVGLAFAAAVCAVSLGMLWRQPRDWKGRLRTAGATMLVAFLVGGVWYLRAAWRGGAIATEEMSQDAARQIGALLIAALPGLLLVRQPGRLTLVLCVASIYVAIGVACFADVRWWAPVVPLLSVAATFVWVEIVPGAGVAHRLARLGLATAAIGSAAAPLTRAQGKFAVAIGWQSREDYLLQHQSTFVGALLANHILRPGDHILSQDPHTFYFSCLATDERGYRRRAAYNPSPVAGGSLSRQLRAAGFTHVLLAESVPRSPIESESNLGELIQRESEGSGDASLLPLAEYQWSDASLKSRRYRLVRLR